MGTLYKTLGKYFHFNEYLAFRLYSTKAVHTSTLAKRTSELNPTLHNKEHIGLFYTIPDTTKDMLFAFGGLPKSFNENIKTFGETSIMVRPAATEIINSLKSTNFDKPVIRYVLYGKPGCGKSLTLVHLLHYALVNKFVIVHVPWVWDWFRNIRFEVAYSATHKGFVDLPLISAHWLKHFQSQNKQLLSELELSIKNTYVWNQRESTPAGSHLSELINHGINRVKYAADCVIAIISELKSFSTEKKCKTFVAIDGFNALFGNVTNLKTEDRTEVTPSMVTLTKAFLEASKQDWRNGAVVLTVDQLSARFKTLHTYFPLSLLGRKGFEHIDPFIPVSVNEYSDLELTSILDYYEDRKWLQNSDGRNELAFLSNKNPYQLMNLCGSS